jgi:hypothetical protein
LVVCVPCVAAGLGLQGGASDPVDEHRIKAAFVVNFLKFVDWPAEQADAPLAVVVIGPDPILAALHNAIEGQTVAGRSIVVSATAGPDVPPEANAVFIARAARAAVPGIVRAVEGRGVLTIGDTEGFGQAGVVLNLYVSDDRVRFEANTAAAARAAVRVSSQLLRIARIVG